MPAGAGVWSLPAALAASRDTDSGKGCPSRWGSWVHRSQRIRSQPWQRRGTRLRGRDCRPQWVFGDWPDWSQKTRLQPWRRPRRRPQERRCRLCRGWLRLESEDCGLAAGFFCGCGASGTGWLCCWAHAPKVSRAVIEATTRGLLRIVAVFILNPAGPAANPGPAPIPFLWKEKLVKN